LLAETFFSLQRRSDPVKIWQRAVGHIAMYQQRSEKLRLSRDLSERDLALLRKVPIFSGLDLDAVNHLLADAFIANYSRNEMLFLRGEPAVNFFIVFEGWVKLIRQTEDGHESVIGVFATGESFAEAALFDQRGYPVTAMAAEDSRLLVIPGSSYMREFRDNPDYAVNVVGAMSRHMRSLVRQIEQLSVTSSTERLARFLLMLCSAGSETAEVRLPMEKSLVAGRLGMQPETLSRALAKLRQIGVGTKGSLVTIEDVEALRAYLKRS
jgi:CRP-like cAMP-binding protein